MKKIPIRLAADYEASGFEVDHSYHDPEEFGLPPEICKDLMEWQEMFEEMFQSGRRDPPNSERNELNKRGELIIQKIKMFLGEENYEYDLYTY